MTADDLGKIIDSASKLLGVLIWPSVIIFIILRFRSSFSEFFSAVTDITLKGGGFEASFEKKVKDEASQALVAAAMAHQSSQKEPEVLANDVRAANSAVKSVTSNTIRRVNGSTILWVDDKPGNNTNEIRALEAFGITITTSLDTNDALERIKTQKFNLIISDMGRPPDPMAGYTLLDKLRASGNSTPFVIYAGSRDPEHIAESRRRGALGCTNRADELFEYVMTELKL